MQYRNMVLDYNQDVKSAEHSEAISAEMKKSAKADFFPKLYGNANFNYTGNAPELTIKSPIEGNEITFQGEGIKYGASLTLAQPVYSGGLIKAGYDKANKQLEMSRNESERITNNILFDADVHYWNTVAGQEMVFTASFTVFHEIFFTNDLWMFDPAEDYMIRMLPEGFFYDMVMRIGAFFVGGLVLLFAVMMAVRQKAFWKYRGKTGEK